MEAGATSWTWKRRKKVPETVWKRQEIKGPSASSGSSHAELLKKTSKNGALGTKKKTDGKTFQTKNVPETVWSIGNEKRSRNEKNGWENLQKKTSVGNEKLSNNGALETMKNRSGNGLETTRNQGAICVIGVEPRRAVENT